MAIGQSSGGGGRSGDVRAGGAFVEISAKETLSKTLLTLKAKSLAFASGLRSVGKSLGVLGGAAFVPLTALFKAGVGRAENINKEAEALGFTIQQYQRLKYAADVAGVSVDDVLSKPEKYADLMAAAPLLDGAAIKDAVTAQRAFRAAIIDLQSALVPLVSALVPIINLVSSFVKANPALVQGLFLAGAAATALGTALYFVGAAIPLLLSPIGLVAAGVAALGAGLYALGSYIFPETTEAAKNSFGEMLSIATDTVGGIVAAISQGDFGAAMEIASAGALAAWKRLSAEMTYVWTRVKDNIVDTFRQAVTSVKMLINDLAAWILRNDFTGLLAGDLTDEEINAGRDAINNEIVNDAEKKKLEARAFRDQQIADANREADEARAELGKRIAGVKRPDALPDDPVSKRITATRGSFRKLLDGNQQFGASDALKTEILIKEGNELLKKMVEEQRKLNDAMRLK